jgi:hypothetical protein
MAQEPTSKHPPLTPLVLQTGRRASLDSVLRDYCTDAQVSWCAVFDEVGVLVASHSPKGFAPKHAAQISKQASELLSASRQLAANFGEREFHGFFQAGDRWHYYLSPVTDRVMLLSVFEQSTLPAAVRASAESFQKRLAAAAS